MKLIYTNKELPQKSDAWLELRTKTIGGSDVAAVIGKNKYEKASTLWKRMTGKLKPKTMNAAMERGSLMEGEALKAVQAELDYKNASVGQYFAIHPKYNFASVSFDGVDIENKYIIEIKCPSVSWNFKSVVENGIPDHYLPQVQWQLMIANAHWGITKAHFGSYFPDGVYVADLFEFKESLKTVCIVDVEYDEPYCQRVLKVVKKFHNFVTYDYWDVEEYEAVLEEFNGH